MDNLEREARERKKKMVALASLPLSVGFFVWRLQDNSRAAPAPQAPPAPIVKKAAPEVQKAAGAVMKLEKEKVVVVASIGKDPFRPAFSTTPPAQASAKATQPPVKTQITELLPPRMPMPLPPLQPFEPVRPLPAIGGSHPVRPTLAPAQPAGPTEPTRPTMPYVLTGIVKGSPDIAILRHWDGSRRIARVGDSLDQTYRLTMIEESFVMVSGDGDAISLRLGGDVRPTVAPEDKK